MKYRRNTLEEAFQAKPGLIPEDQWKEFVEIQFTDKAKVKLKQYIFIYVCTIIYIYIYHI